MKIPVLNLSGEKVKEIDLPKFFEMEFNPALVHQVMRWQLLNTYFPYAHTKTRSEVAGSGRKPWPQKHTGRARHGSRRSPIWRGGGVTFGPRKEEKKQIKITKKMRRKAILMTVAEKFRKNLLKCFENFPLEGKTKEMAKFLTKFLEPRKTKKKYETCLLVIPENDKKIFQAVRNLPYADAIEARNLNLLSLLNHKYLFLTPESLSVIEKTFKK
jgi:large subunit ribosomal protein L4